MCVCVCVCVAKGWRCAIKHTSALQCSYTYLQSVESHKRPKPVHLGQVHLESPNETRGKHKYKESQQERYVWRDRVNTVTIDTAGGGVGTTNLFC